MMTPLDADLVPEGFEPFPLSPFLETIGPMWIRRADHPPTFGLVVHDRHANSVGIAHGGLLVALADLALAQGIRVEPGPELRLVTTSLTVDFAEAVPLGAWVEAQADIQRRAGSTVFASCFLISNGRRSVRASGIFTVLGR